MGSVNSIRVHCSQLTCQQLQAEPKKKKKKRKKKKKTCETWNVAVDVEFKHIPKVSHSITPTILAKSGDPIRIQWSGISSPTKLDWLGIYNPPNSSHVNFIGYVFLSSSATWQSRSGSISIPLINLWSKSNYSFRIFQWVESKIDPKHHDHDHNPLPGTTHLLKKLMEVGFEISRGPEQIHLRFSKNEDEMRVMFMTKDHEERWVRHGEREDMLDEMVVTNVERYEREHVWGLDMAKRAGQVGFGSG